VHTYQILVINQIFVVVYKIQSWYGWFSFNYDLFLDVRFFWVFMSPPFSDIQQKSIVIENAKNQLELGVVQ
jgi:hypothetical protein